MIYGVLSDIHGNWEAFSAALKRLKAEGAQKYIFCGDLIGYGPDPEKCVQKFCKLQEEEGAVGVMGNHDVIFTHPEILQYFNFEAIRSLERSATQLGNKSVQCLTSLPEKVTGENFTVVHGTPMDPIKEYLANCNQYRAAYQRWEGQILFVGHTHLPFYMQGNEKDCHVFVVKKEAQIQLDDAFRYVINPGSVGKPRDNDVRASFGLWNTEKKIFRFLREPYDIAKTQEKMRAAGMPSFLIDSLSLGM